MATAAKAAIEKPESKTRVEATKLKQQAKTHFAAMLQLAKAARLSTMEIGWLGHRMKEAQEFAVLGMEEGDVRAKLQLERSTWYRALQTAAGLVKLPKKEYLQLYSGKAYLLVTRLSEAERYKPQWLKRAADPELSESALEEMIDAAEASGDVKSDATVAEPRSWLKIRMYDSAKEVVMEKLDEFCKKHGLGDDYGRALELILVEQSDRGGSILKVIQDRLPNLKGAITLVKDADETCVRCVAIKKAAEPFVLELAKAAGVK